jgi:hypothetical protein
MHQYLSSANMPTQSWREGKGIRAHGVCLKYLVATCSIKTKTGKTRRKLTCSQRQFCSELLDGETWTALWKKRKET